MNNEQKTMRVNSRILKILHENPQNDDDVIVKRVALRKQREELMEQPLVWVTCPCGVKLALKMAYRCWFCGLTFCEKCAEKHFGKKCKQS